MIQYGLHLYTYVRKMSNQTWDVLPKLKSFGFDGCEIPLMPGEMDDFDHHLARNKLAEHEMNAVGSTGMTPDMCIASECEHVREKGIAHMKHAIDITAALGGAILCGALYAAYGWRPKSGRSAEQWRRSIYSMQTIARYAADRNIVLCLEPLNRYEHYFLNTIEDALCYIAEVDEPNLKIHIDTYHMNIEEKDIFSSTLRPGTCLGHVHCSENDRGIPGTGHFEWSSFFQGLKEIKYSGWLIIESFFEPIPSIVDFSPIWRQLAKDADTLATQSLRFIKESMTSQGKLADMHKSVL